MHEKLKSVFRRSSQSRNSSGQHESNSPPSKASPPSGNRQRVSSDSHGRTSVDSSATGSIYSGRSRPVGSIYDDSRYRARTGPKDFVTPTDPNGGAIAIDYNAYLPALSPVNDDYGDDYTTRSGSQHEEYVADRNIARYSSSFDGGHRKAPSSNSPSVRQHSHKQFSGAGSVRATSNPVQNACSFGKYSIAHDIARNGERHEGAHSNPGTSTHEGSLRNISSFPPGSVRADTGIERKPLVSRSDKATSRSTQGARDDQGSHSSIRYATVDGRRNGEETALARKLREEGVADLRNTVDTDGDVTWAPGKRFVLGLPACCTKRIDNLNVLTTTQLSHMRS